ncbi:MAG: hypothetical protein ABIF06_01285 [bacterium]
MTMEAPEFFDPNEVKLEIDPAIGRFKYDKSDRERLRERGLTDQEIDQKEALANDNIAKKAA